MELGMYAEGTIKESEQMLEGIWKEIRKANGKQLGNDRYSILEGAWKEKL